jgi:D-glycero-alpha-D-manno-heptose-7-phosphate kinase
LIVTRTPIRISLGAGGTDLPFYYSRLGARFAAAAGSGYTYVMVNHHPDKVVWMGLNRAERVDSADKLTNRVVNKVLQRLELSRNIQVVSVSDVAPNSGLGTSSSFIVGLLNALHAYKGEYLWPNEIAEEACYVEQVLLGEQTGKQDQYAAAHGGLIWLEIEKDGKVATSRLNLRADFIRELQSRMVFFYTGIQRNSSSVQSWHRNAEENGGGEALDVLKQIAGIAISIRKALQDEDSHEFGSLVDSHWTFKRMLSNGIASHEIDRLYGIAKESGAIGGNLMGAGGGGYFMFVCGDRDAEVRLCKRLTIEGLRRVDLQFEMQGSTVVNLERNDAR